MEEVLEQVFAQHTVRFRTALRRFGEVAPPNRGPDAGEHLGTRHMGGN